ncbi:hypothetical protein KCTCHS21_04340 [Cohnella abietis]|uniref:Uncharacterized protein n=2 Tax=Cohnella abietis TaxID=2507935 RepID=A0A3T1CZ55_9BACL|nr:hypothetical protein KCTCHS21_04340 [Cohnella abietis]
MSSLLILFTFIAALFTIVMKKDEIHKRNLAAWLLENIDQVRATGLAFNGVYIDRETVFIQYELCFSWVMFTYQSKTSYYIKEYHPTPILSLLFNSFCLIFGWCALPKGPIFTIAAIHHNLLSKPISLDSVVRDIRLQ